MEINGFIDVLTADDDKGPDILILCFFIRICIRIGPNPTLWCNVNDEKKLYVNNHFTAEWLRSSVVSFLIKPSIYMLDIY